MKSTQDDSRLFFFIALGLALILTQKAKGLSPLEITFWGIFMLALAALAILIWWQYKEFFAEKSVALRKRLNSIPSTLRDEDSAYLGHDLELNLSIHLPDNIRSRHVHILGATGSGKTESVILNLIAHDAANLRPIIILDAKGDASFLSFLNSKPFIQKRLQMFDLGSEISPFAYDPICAGTNEEKVNRIMNSLRWSEEFYKEQARSVLKDIFEAARVQNVGLTFKDINALLRSAESINKFLKAMEPVTKSQFEQIAGLRAQLRSLSTGVVGDNLSPNEERPTINLEQSIRNKRILYFRLQSLLDSESVAALGRMIVADLASYTGHIHSRGAKDISFCPVFLDEFGSLACSAFVDLISKARSAGLALHFSHQSMGDLKRVDPFLMQQVLDNSSTKIVMRIYDPETAEYLARSFGTRLDRKLTHKVESVNGEVELQEQGSLREVQTFRASPNEMKYLPTGQGFAFIAHGEVHSREAASVHKLQFPKLAS